MKIGYLRISTKGQRPDRQIDGLQGHCDKLYIETLSAVSAKRPVFEAILDELSGGDTLVVWDLDRAFRSTEDAIVHERQLRDRGITFKALNMVVDTSTADGNYNYQTRAAAAEHERRKISERTKEGLRAARKRGKQLGQPPKMSDIQISEAIHLLATTDITRKQLSYRYNVHPWTLSRSILRYEKKIHEKAAQ